MGIISGILIMNVWMYVVGMLEKTVKHCALNFWDQGVALFVGSLGQNGNGEMIYALADSLCSQFKTCNGTHVGGSMVNMEIFKLLQTEREKIRNGDCSTTADAIKSIVSWMSVPLIQGALLSAHKSAKGLQGPSHQIDNAVYLRAMLPLVTECNAKSAEVLSEAMGNGVHSTDDFASVKLAFE